MLRKKKILLGKLIGFLIVFLMFIGTANAALTLGTLVMNPQPGSTGQGTVLVNVFRLDFPVSGSGGTLTLNSIKVTSGNTADADVASLGVRLWTGTTTGPNTQIGTSQTFSAGAVTFSSLSLSLPAGTTYIWVTYNVASAATVSDILNAKTNAGDITITAAGGATAPGTQPPSALDPASNITITAFSAHVTGGLNAGDAVVVKNSDCAAPSVILAGGLNSGDAVGIKNSNCAAPSVILAGGLNSGDGVGIKNSNCATPSNILAGGSNSGDGVGIKNSNCASPSNILAGGINSGDAVGIKNSNCASPSNILAGGINSGDAVGVKNSNCASPTNILAGGINSGDATGMFTCTSCVAPTLGTSVTNVTCNGGSNGTATVTTTGGTSPFGYAWSNGRTTSSISSLTAGTYSVTVTALGGCTATATATVTQPAAALSMASCSHSDATCFGGSNGTATAGTLSNAVGTVHYLWSNSQSTSSISGLSAATYTLTVSDNCSSVTCSQTVGQPATPLAMSACSHTDATCFGGSNGTATAGLVSNAIGTIHYSWSNGQSTSSITGLSAATYTLTVTDNCGSVTCAQTVSQPTQLIASANSNSPVCNMDSIHLSSSVSGGTGAYHYSWTGPNSFTSTAAGPSFLASSANYSGTYSLTATDDNNCTATATAGVTVNNCSVTFTVKFYIQGYYLSSGTLSPLLHLIDATHHTTTDVDTVTVELHNSISPYDSVYGYRGILQNSGNITCTLGPGASGNFYIVVKHRNSLTTWSNGAQSISSGGSYDFTSGAAQAFNSNMANLGDGRFGIYSGDVNRDGNIDISDKYLLQSDLGLILWAAHFQTDLNGDGFVDEGDYRVLENNLPTISVQRPH